MWSPWYVSRMNYNPDIHHRRSIRLKGYDYSRAGAYFVTIVTQGRACCFGEVASKEMCLNDAGRMACQVWESLSLRFSGIEIDAFVVMPNHIHGIINVGAQVQDPRNYYDHVVRDDESLRRVRQYIVDNPAQWIFDRENPQASAPRHGKIVADDLCRGVL